MIPGPVVLVWIVVIGSMLALVWLSPTGARRRGPSWFDLQPFLRESKKARGRAQQKRRR